MEGRKQNQKGVGERKRGKTSHELLNVSFERDRVATVRSGRGGDKTRLVALV